MHADALPMVYQLEEARLIQADLREKLRTARREEDDQDLRLREALAKLREMEVCKMMGGAPVRGRLGW